MGNFSIIKKTSQDPYPHLGANLTKGEKKTGRVRDSLGHTVSVYNPRSPSAGHFYYITFNSRLLHSMVVSEFQEGKSHCVSV